MNNPIFFVDVDNTLLDNDKIKIEIENAIEKTLGKKEAEHFWHHNKIYRKKFDLVNFPKVIREYCEEEKTQSCNTQLNNIFDHIDFERALYTDALKSLDFLREKGKVYIFTEGDAIYQRKKVEKSTIAKHADKVYLFEHKNEHLEEITENLKEYPLFFIDDKDDRLIEIKKRIPNAKTMVVCQGHYAKENCEIDHKADEVLASISDILNYNF